MFTFTITSFFFVVSVIEKNVSAANAEVKWIQLQGSQISQKVFASLLNTGQF